MAEDNQGAKPLEQPNEPLPRTYNQVLGTNRPPKTSWPEVVGLTAEEAEKKIKQEMEGVQIHVLPSGSFVTCDFNPRRVRLFLDQSRKIAREPKIG